MKCDFVEYNRIFSKENLENISHHEFNIFWLKYVFKHAKYLKSETPLFYSEKKN